MGLKPDTILYTSIITACARRGDSNGAYEVFAAMREEAVAPNEHTYASLMTACCTEMRNLKKSAACDTTMRRRLKYLADRAQNSLANMETVSVKPDIITYNAMLDICRQSEDLERSALTLAPPTPSRPCVPPLWPSDGGAALRVDSQGVSDLGGGGARGAGAHCTELRHHHERMRVRTAGANPTLPFNATALR